MTLILADTFNRSNTTFIQGPGNSWQDLYGLANPGTNGNWKINGGVLVPQYTSGSRPAVCLMRPASETTTSMGAVLVSPDIANGTCNGIIMNGQVSGNTVGACYAGNVYANVLYIDSTIGSHIASQAWTPTAGHSYALRFDWVTNGTTSTLTLGVYDLASPGAPVTTLTTTSSAAGLQTASGQAGIVPYSNNVTGWYSYNNSGSNAPTAGTLTAGTPGPFTIPFTATAPSGIGPFVEQLNRSLSAGFTPGAGTVVAGATGLAPTDASVPDAQTYHYKQVVTDLIGNTATTNEVTAALAALSASTDTTITWQDVSGQSLGVVLYTPAGTAWNGSAFAFPTAATFASFLLSMTEVAALGNYVLALGGLGLPAGSLLRAAGYAAGQSGGKPIFTTATFVWDGAKIVPSIAPAPGLTGQTN